MNYARARLTALATLMAALVTGPAVAEPSPVLAAYSFDDLRIETGPDTFAVIQNAEGQVRLSSEFRWSGARSVELRDVPGDGDFPELQGSFEERAGGWLVVHFALLVVDPAQELNVALAGPAGFRLAKDGIAVWLKTRADGTLTHVSDSIPKKLLRLTPFTWYGVDVDYDLEHGRYNLRLYEEGRAEPVIDLQRQPNAANQPGSRVSMFSFIGDPGTDTSAVTYYVDDVFLGSDPAVDLPPFVAPGRRSFLADALCEAADGGAGVADPETDASAEFRVLLAAERFQEAAALAVASASGERGPGAPSGPTSARWMERAGDAAFCERRLAAALERYTVAAELAADSELPALLMRLADVHFLLGDAAAERRLRESLYGTLR